MAPGSKNAVWVALFALLVMGLGVVAWQAGRLGWEAPADKTTATPTTPNTPTWTASPSPRASPRATEVVYLTDTPAATDTEQPTDTPPPTPTAEVWQECVVTAALRVRSSYSLQADVLRLLAVDDRITIDASRRPVVADGYRWFALVDGGGWIAEGWMVCG